MKFICDVFFIDSGPAFHVHENIGAPARLCPQTSWNLSASPYQTSRHNSSYQYLISVANT